LRRDKSLLAEKLDAAAMVIPRLDLSKATFALLKVSLLVPQMRRSMLSSIASGDKLHHNLQLRKSLLSMMSAEDVLALITAAVVHSENHGPMSARRLELAAQMLGMEISCASRSGTQKLTSNSTAFLIWEP